MEEVSLSYSSSLILVSPLFLSFPSPPWLPTAWEERERKEGMDSRVTGARPPGDFGYSLTFREPKT